MDRQKFLKLGAALGTGHMFHPLLGLTKAPQSTIRSTALNPVIRWVLLAFAQEIFKRAVIDPVLDYVFDYSNNQDPRRRGSGYKDTRSLLEKHGYDLAWMDDSRVTLPSSRGGVRSLTPVQESPESRIVGISFVDKGSGVNVQRKEFRTAYFLEKVQELEPIAIMPESHHILLIHLARRFNYTGHEYDSLARWMLPSGLLTKVESIDQLWNLATYKTSNGKLKIQTEKNLDRVTGEIKSISGNIEFIRGPGDSDNHLISTFDVQQLRSHYAHL